MPTVLNDLLSSLTQDAPVRDLLVAAHWTVVCSHHAGMASTLMPVGPHGHSRVRDAGRLQLRGARELAELARSSELTEASIGVAAMNSLLEMDPSTAQDINASDVLLNRGRDKNVALIGHFRFIPELRDAARRLWVFELQPEEDEYPAESAGALLPEADVVAITSMTLANHTLDALLALCSPKATVMLLGPSTPLSPILFDHGVNILAGARVIDEAAVLRTVSQGASFPQVEGVQLLTFVREKEA
jgi:uncharacterized protein (DUF4213/DUF364 family)